MNRLPFSVETLCSSKRVRCSLFFLAGGVGIGAWASSLPLLAAKLGLDKGQLGTLLLCFALGAIVLMVNVGRISDRFSGSYALSLGGSLVFGLAILMIPFVDGLVMVGALVLLAGAAFGTLDVSMNIEASDIERATERHLMSSFHALFSIGNIVGASLVGFLASYGGGLRECLGGAGILVLLSALSTRFVARNDTRQQSRATDTGATDSQATLNRSQTLLVLLFGVVAFLAFLAEGGIMDWSAVYMVDTLGSSESVGAYAFAIFAAAMAIGRLLGDGVTKRIGHVNVLRFGGLVCALSLSTMLIGNSVEISLAVLALCGFGVANMIPAVFASAGRIGSGAAGRAMSIVTTMGYSGLLFGPALLGFVAQVSSLTVSLGLVTLAFALISLGTLYLKRRLSQFRKQTQTSESFA
ncbi:MFS transporter [Sinorhizobium americanum]|uniref:Fucose permease n=1 Tax=Sinorhizobium americanum TaxID=194963 RepID=A0A4R2AZ09_9HYPH|nr:MFS transporter [Sinorhizobium americanum]TCN19271.1 fucose permease [Sinorhizobium americanum]